MLYILSAMIYLILQSLIMNRTIEFFTIRISVRLFDRFKVTQNKIYFIKNCSEWGLNSQPMDHQSNALPTELSYYLGVCVNQ